MENRRSEVVCDEKRADGIDVRQMDPCGSETPLEHELLSWLDESAVPEDFYYTIDGAAVRAVVARLARELDELAGQILGKPTAMERGGTLLLPLSGEVRTFSATDVEKAYARGMEHGRRDHETTRDTLGLAWLRDSCDTMAAALSTMIMDEMDEEARRNMDAAHDLLGEARGCVRIALRCHESAHDRRETAREFLEADEARLRHEGAAAPVRQIVEGDRSDFMAPRWRRMDEEHPPGNYCGGEWCDGGPRADDLLVPRIAFGPIPPEPVEIDDEHDRRERIVDELVYDPLPDVSGLETDS
jgi:hypothetical protein